MFNVARKGLLVLKGGVLQENPVAAVRFLDEQNIRDRVLTPEEFQRMVRGVSRLPAAGAHLCVPHRHAAGRNP